MADPYSANVSLLLHCDGADGSTTFTDNSPTPKTVTPTNATISTAQSKWGGASAYFPGDSGSRLGLNASADCTFGTGDFTIEMWIRPTSHASIRAMYDDSTTSSFGSTGSIAIVQQYSGWNVYLDGSPIYQYGTGSITLNTWQHIALTRSGTAIKFFIDGSLFLNTTTSASFSCPSGRPLIGSGSDVNGDGVYNFPYMGHLDDVRVTKGVARYTAAFTPPTAAFDNPTPAIDPYSANVSLLLHCDGANGSTTFTDNSSNPKTISVTGSTAVSTAQSKFGGASIRFDGSASQLATSASSNLAFGTGDFTIEFFLNISTAKAFGFFYLTTGGLTPHLLVATGTSGRTLRAFVSGVIDLNGPTTLDLNTWYHVAVTRSGSTVRVFLNGVLEVSGTCSSDFTDTSAIIGETLDPIDAYIDELRVTKGVARYTAAFTPPTAAFDNPVSLAPLGKLINTSLSKSAFQWSSLSPKYVIQQNVLSKSAFQWSLLPKRYTTIYTSYKARNDFQQANYGGVGTISGTVKIGTTAAKRRVRLYEKSTGILIREIWSAGDGTYTFLGLNKGYLYTVTSTDLNVDGAYNDVVFANITAV